MGILLALFAAAAVATGCSNRAVAQTTGPGPAAHIAQTVWSYPQPLAVQVTPPKSSVTNGLL